jgi:hypothetical protein
MSRFIMALCLAALLIAGCTPAPVSDLPAPPAATDGPKTPQALQSTPVSTTLFQVIKPDGSSVGFSWDDLKKLPLASLTIEGKVEEGPKLSDVLKAAGVSDFTQVTLSGSASPVTLPKNQVDDNTILDFNNHGTVKLASTYIPKPDWTKDVSKIEVK